MLSDGGTSYLPGVGQWDGEEWSYALGSTRQLAGADGDIVQRYDYSPFGKVAAVEGERPSVLQYTGEHWDGDVGLLYLRARWYDPAIGRFLSKDPFPGYAEFPQTQHPYVYARNNPVNLTDPSGEFAFIPLLLVGAAGGALGGLGYYAIKTALNPCTDWNWREAAFWTGAGTGMGAILGSGIYGGWWLGTQLGWWGSTAGVTTGANVVYRYVQNGMTRYVGITNNFTRRLGEHLQQRAWRIQPIPGLEQLSRTDARAVEQVLIEHYKLGNLLNEINSIAVTNPIYQEAIQRGTEILEQIGFFQ